MLTCFTNLSNGVKVALLSIGKCRKFDDGPYENLLKFGYNLNIKSKYLIQRKNIF
jgi:hypothetical protein